MILHKVAQKSTSFRPMTMSYWRSCLLHLLCSHNKMQVAQSRLEARINGQLDRENTLQKPIRIAIAAAADRCVAQDRTRKRCPPN